MMRCYLRPNPIKAISFDLDDCLYDNRPILKQALRALQQHLQTLDARFAHWHYQDWLQLKRHCQRLAPQLKDSVTWTRRATLVLALQGYQIPNPQTQADTAMDVFMKARSDLNMSSDITAMLTELGRHYPLVAISNGNLNLQQSGLDKFFTHVYKADVGQASKPASHMFAQACRDLDILPHQLMHVGDHPLSDVAGARRFGAVSVWLNPGFNRQQELKANGILPHWQISNPLELLQLVY
ncbi:HAD-IA family hydrolase [Paraferrimonas haliotis]|nr:HAD-IA family hydrolase [Paraferrimonas haliotis]